MKIETRYGPDTSAEQTGEAMMEAFGQTLEKSVIESLHLKWSSLVISPSARHIIKGGGGWLFYPKW